ncbi:MAG: 4Fe-4S binding protein [Anaerosomatales bacterium]
MSKWDISDMDSWKSSQFPLGAVIPDAGNSRDYVTGGWRSMRPVRNAETCTECLICWIFCPDSAIRVADEKLAADPETFNLDHCKGCGICANECPVEAITMVPEGCEITGVK